MDVTGHSLFLLQQLNVQREFGFLCDCTVAIGNVYFKAHRAVLAAFSNYFKMIFIHQSSECIKIQPSDIQPDVFSYLLHLMYTGTGPKQPVDQGRLQEGIKFLHAYQLCRAPGEGGAEPPCDPVRMSNLYGIQISSQLAGKGGASRDPEARGRVSQGVASQPQSFRPVSSADESDLCARVKQEEEEEVGVALLCPRCGERCLSPEGLQEHLYSHAPCVLAEGPSEAGKEEGLRHGAELRRGSPPTPFTRRKKMACAVCHLRFTQKSQLREHMFAHVGKPLRCQRYSREVGGDTLENGCYSLDSEVSQESADAARVE